jgi:hypothetical protein
VLEGACKEFAHERWVRHRATFRDNIHKAIEQDPEPLADFEEKVRRHFRHDLTERAVSDFRSDLENQWEKAGYNDF